MKAIIDGKRYDTETAELIGEASSSYSQNDFKWWQEALYKSPKGQFFLAGEGHAMSQWAENYADGKGPGSGIRLLSEVEARKWAERYMKAWEVEEHFSVEEG